MAPYFRIFPYNQFTMKTLFTTLIAVVFLASCGNQTAEKTESKELTADQLAIEQVIQNGYISGLQNEGDSVKIDQNFHPQFEMIGHADDGSLWKRSIAQWRDRQIERRGNGELPNEGDELISGEFEFIDVTQDVAVAKLHYYKGERLAYTDLISLYKINGEWRIVSKVFTTIE